MRSRFCQSIGTFTEPALLPHRNTTHPARPGLLVEEALGGCLLSSAIEQHCSSYAAVQWWTLHGSLRPSKGHKERRNRSAFGDIPDHFIDDLAIGSKRSKLICPLPLGVIPLSYSTAVPYAFGGQLVYCDCINTTIHKSAHKLQGFPSMKAGTLLSRVKGLYCGAVLFNV